MFQVKGQRTSVTVTSGGFAGAAARGSRAAK
jgi:hypothetical protein